MAITRNADTILKARGFFFFARRFAGLEEADAAGLVFTGWLDLVLCDGFPEGAVLCLDADDLHDGFLPADDASVADMIESAGSFACVTAALLALFASRSFISVFSDISFLNMLNFSTAYAPEPKQIGNYNDSLMIRSCQKTALNTRMRCSPDGSQHRMSMEYFLESMDHSLRTDRQSLIIKRRTYP